MISTAAPDIDRCLPQSKPCNTGLLGDPTAAGNLSLLVEFSGRLAEYEQLPGERTRLMLRFANVPAGVHLFVTTEEVSSAPANLSASLTSTDFNGAGPFQKPRILGHADFHHRSFALSEIELQGGWGTAVWEIVNAGTDKSQRLTFGIAVAYAPLASQNLPALGSATAAATFAPIATVTGASATAPIPRFADISSAVPVFSIIR